ncbi:DUF5753 domain-containing protein [Actinokineospora terrae]|uniref:Helix-turn-helix domain-containing protein n=1 Tax=Actinokineospora terrae TaxID=155974 RepID=A0A1H9WZJ3_9PSEU|nr:DUF5753 domain-containing protein [Actinokineospora terrae]SES39087.1 Helix-turn-helix domain-containing protein [Actinokineospora terrae]
MGREPDPWVSRKLLGRRLRRERERLGRTQQEVVAALEWSLSKLQRIEAGTHGVSTTDLRSLLAHYGTGAEQESYLAEARAGREKSWYAAFRDVLSTQVTRLFGYESIATSIRQVNPLHIPGPLQTRAYAREQLTPYFAEPRLGQAIEARVERQRRLWGTDRPEAAMVIDESAIRRLVGGPEVMREQLQRLVQAATEPHMSVRVVPFSAGWHYGLEGSFILIDVADPQGRTETVLYQEQADRDFFTDDDAEVLTAYDAKWDALEAVALGERESGELIADQLRLLEP